MKIGEYISQSGDKVDHSTIVRDIEVLLLGEYIIKKGHGRGVKYSVKNNNFLTQFIAVNEYFL